MLVSMTCYPLCSVSSWTGIHSLTSESYRPFKTTITILKLQSLLLCIKLICFISQRAYIKFHLRNYYKHSFYEHTSLGSLNGTHCLNSMRYYGTFIENTYCYRLPSTMTQFVGNIWSTYDLTRRSKSLLILKQTQYFLKIERLTQWNNLVRLWLLDSLNSWLTVGPI